VDLNVCFILVNHIVGLIRGLKMNKGKSLNCCSVSRCTLGDVTPGPDLREIKSGRHTKAEKKMSYISGGDFLMGSKDSDGNREDGEGPVRKIRIRPYYMDTTAVTNNEFSAFVGETGYKTDAEKFGWSFVFHLLIHESQFSKAKQISQIPWWFALKDAYWFQPEGAGSSIQDRMEHPVTHISWNDAAAFCKWAEKRLPTEAEWEYAARGGLTQKKFPWGDELNPNGEHYCNIWQGVFPTKNTEKDGYLGTAPAKSYPANGFGLYNMSGNVWEWCADWFSSEINLKDINNPKGPICGENKVVRGGSYLCHKSYCNRYRVAARSSNTIDTSAGNLGFRCVKDI
jgi:formylglycine-generating enzyme required for sulfatase activity